MIRSLRRAAVLAAVLAATALAAPAQADPGFDPPPGGGTPPSSSPRKEAKVPGTDCQVWGSDNGFGAVCHAADGHGKTVQQILKDAGIPDCWDQQLTPDLVDAYAQQKQQKLQQGEQGDFWTQVCTAFDDHNNLVPSSSVIWVRAGQEVLLSQDQLDLIALEKERDLPAPGFGLSPLARPRVGQWVSFHLNPIGTEQGATPYEVTLNRGGVQLVVQARLDHAEFSPEGAAPAPPLSCPGAGVVAGPLDTPATLPQGCWWRYLHSSAAQPDQVYPVHAWASWQIWYQVGGVWTRLPDVFRKDLGWLAVQVTEIQTVVVP